MVKGLVMTLPKVNPVDKDKKNKTLYWVKFIEQSNGMTLDAYFEAESISKLDEGIADILEIKVIKEVIQL